MWTPYHFHTYPQFFCARPDSNNRNEATSSVLTILCLDIHPQIQRDRKYSSCWTKAIHCNYNIRSLCSSEMLHCVDWQLVLLGMLDPQRSDCPKTTVTIYQSTVKEHRPHLHCGRSQRLYNIELHTFWSRGIYNPRYCRNISQAGTLKHGGTVERVHSISTSETTDTVVTVNDVEALETEDTVVISHSVGQY